MANSPITRTGTIRAETRTHLAHGLRSQLKPDGTFRIQPVGEKVGIQINDVNAERFASLIVHMQLLIIGIESFDGESGERLDWMPAASLEAADKFGERPDRIWSQIGYAAGLKHNERAQHICEAISFHYLAAEISLRRISESYYDLQRHVHQSKTPIGHRFTTTHIFELYSDVHSFFVNVGSLRDYIASFVSEIVLGLGKVSGHSALLKKINCSRSAIEEVIDRFSDKAYRPIGIAHIGEYRDILVHRSPIGRINEEWVDVVALRPPLPVGSGGVTLKLPGNPYDLKGSQVDALVLAHHALVVMAEYSHLIARQSPLRPHIPHFTIRDGQLEEVLPDA